VIKLQNFVYFKKMDSKNGAAVSDSKLSVDLGLFIFQHMTTVNYNFDEVIQNGNGKVVVVDKEGKIQYDETYESPYQMVYDHVVKECSSFAKIPDTKVANAVVSAFFWLYITTEMNSLKEAKLPKIEISAEYNFFALVYNTMKELFTLRDYTEMRIKSEDVVTHIEQKFNVCDEIVSEDALTHLECEWIKIAVQVCVGIEVFRTQTRRIKTVLNVFDQKCKPVDPVDAVEVKLCSVFFGLTSNCTRTIPVNEREYLSNEMKLAFRVFDVVQGFNLSVCPVPDQTEVIDRVSKLETATTSDSCFIYLLAAVLISILSTH
jgi:hypothetical protein